MFRDPVQAAIRALEAELEGGPRADLPPAMEKLAMLLLQREERTLKREQAQPERELLAAMPAAAGLVAPDGRIRASNAGLDRFSPGGRAIGHTLLEITRSAELAEAARRALEGTPKQLELQLAQRSFIANVVPMLRGEALALLRDVTEARMAEATRRDFVANASHELRTPVSAIAGAAETLLSGAMDDPAQARAFVEMIARNAERLGRLTNDLLDLSRIESRQWPLSLEAVGVEEVARRALDLIGDPARRRRIELAVQVPEGIVVQADARALEHVLVNLLDNAVKYTPEGGRATVTAVADDAGRVEIAVSDTGPGIERHHLPRLFERFYRVDPGRSRGAGGTGLGLAIVKHLVQMQGGEISVDTGPGGTSFRVRLPRAGQKPAS
ncbi:MAG TPA: ATP-binding protein [Anaeromyxobacteraceae bacterium]|nr:ATP-binding protein [Anaeromyxobacteraceae bacterium]